MSLAGVPGSALSAATVTAASPSSAAASASDSSDLPERTTRAPSATRTSAVALPSPRAPPVMTNTRSWRPRSTTQGCHDACLDDEEAPMATVPDLEAALRLRRFTLLVLALNVLAAVVAVWANWPAQFGGVGKDAG